MRQQWLILSIVAVLMSGCNITGNDQTSSLPPVPTRDVLGAEPQYEPYHPSANRDYQRDGQTYHIVQDLAHFTQTGYASWFGEESNGKLTAIGERASPYALAAAHPTLPIPSYVRVTNLSNGRMMIVRINDRGPYNKPGKIIELSHAAAERLNLMPQSKVKLDGILVSPDGSLSGLGTEGSTIVKQSFALPERPNLSSQSSMLPAVTSNSADEKTEQQPPVERATTSPAPESTNGYMVQVGAISAEPKAKEWQQTLSQRFNVQGRIIPFGNVYRVQLGPFNNRQQAMELQKKLTDQMQQSSFIVAP
ncbi:endolytic peptidoglycan transglycosylase RlpA [Xenorhabdus griffiniae]|uniref:Endolytic peptidoglycan transglycosylase RlpA n=1 Tax=Xenorhabdus griffiniae TaxID=351672 RepID=A0ABY9XEF5_9GAMM|nr:endolytic peptidoglycan transglycosylase RlpA [Xenorhabdus griffiniae]MBD1228710.1 endolytic peptidoglycan transglycosylase RlpA [Xenorhabdus griffiniae]MBE8587593.1 endolytic peptidoglycan transglycosylase RlpA [Xenorhabdus griffiniae]WMV71301.1 endolytic peptidoglycan transglycosylase RlpA [Xenorhabdus griffiniae]WNH00977.1 endolytic peptidoglycan transglycosylase RlpA [Xenorhabdus griffiniae]